VAPAEPAPAPYPTQPAPKKGGAAKFLIPLVACVALAVAAVVVGAVASSGDEDGKQIAVATSTTEAKTPTTERSTTTTQPTTTTVPTTTTTEPTTTTQAPTTAPAPPTTEATVSQMNARQKAVEYLDFTSFSRSGLIGQLEFEGFTQEDAAYGVDALNVDWNEQAAKKAAEYLDFTSFSRSGLIDQLVFEGFTQAQAEYGVSTTGL
jgi:hypothetical protein